MKKYTTSYIKRLRSEASDCCQKGKWLLARKLFIELHRLDPLDAESLFQLGMIEFYTGNFNESASILQKSIAIDPTKSKASFHLANIYLSVAKFEDALVNYDKSILLEPGLAEAHNNRGNALLELGMLEEALESYSNAISLDSKYADALNNQGNVLIELNRFDCALVSYSAAIKLKSKDPELYFNRGIAFDKLKRFEEAFSDYSQAISIDAEYVEAYFNRGVVLGQMKKLQEAISDYSRAIQLNPSYVKAYFNRGLVQQTLRNFNNALIDYDQVIELDSRDEQAYYNRGIAFSELRWMEESLLNYTRAIELKPDYVDAYIARGCLHHEEKRFDEALFDFNYADGLQPNNVVIFEHMMASKMHGCIWDGYDDLKSKIYNNNQPTNLFNQFALIDDPECHLKITQLGVKNNWPKNELPPKDLNNSKNKKIRIGYYSADYSDHPVAYLTSQLFELHDRNKFEVIAFSFGRETKSLIKKRLIKGFDQFIEVRNKTDQEIAMLTREMEIDIAVDLGGYTKDCRTNIFAMRASPIQVNYLGYAGTMAADYMDYIIGDAILIPSDAQCYYSEKVAYLPGTFMVNDSTLKPSDEVFSRKDFNLPEDGFIFSCFNASYKITPSTFLGWMRILNAVDRSVLWLSHMNETAMKNLKDKAAEYGIDRDRIIFASRMPSLSDHLSRIRLADLFLDTFPYNAHTTSNDALRVGLPVLTLMGKSFASRVAASLLNAVDLPELITHSQEEYESLAIGLASNPEKLKKLRNKLLDTLPGSYLTDTKRFTKNLELAYQEMYRRSQEGLSPDNIYIN